MKKTALPVINFYAYTFLLIVTPFLMLQNYLQNTIGSLSRATLDLGFMKAPYTVLFAIALLTTTFIAGRKKMDKYRFSILGIIVIFFATGQLIADYYFGHHFSDLQHNWHYIAYGIFSFIAYRRFSVKPVKLPILLMKIFAMALLISVFDEIIQVFISNRIFDLSDCAKDVWGSITGIVFVFFFLEKGKGFPDFKIRHPKIKDYFKHPFSVLFLETMLALIFLLVSSQLTNHIYVPQVIILTCAFFLVCFLLLHAGRSVTARWIIRAAALLILIFILFSAHFKTPVLKYFGPGKMSYNGIPVLYFDFMVYPEGGFRIVDKKESFNVRDKYKIESLNPDILLIGTGSKGQGGKGWDDSAVTEMVYNKTFGQVYQIIKLPNKQVCNVFNRLKKENKKVLLIIHNS